MQRAQLTQNRRSGQPERLIARRDRGRLPQPFIRTSFDVVGRRDRRSRHGQTLSDPHAVRIALGGLPNHLLKARENALASP
jgi:hypothetical protein